jgi:hypothetical protein
MLGEDLDADVRANEFLYDVYLCHPYHYALSCVRVNELESLPLPTAHMHAVKNIYVSQRHVTLISMSTGGGAPCAGTGNLTSGPNVNVNVVPRALQRPIYVR